MWPRRKGMVSSALLPVDPLGERTIFAPLSPIRHLDPVLCSFERPDSSTLRPSKAPSTQATRPPGTCLNQPLGKRVTTPLRARLDPGPTAMSLSVMRGYYGVQRWNRLWGVTRALGQVALSVLPEVWLGWSSLTNAT